MLAAPTPSISWYWKIDEEGEWKALMWGRVNRARTCRSVEVANRTVMRWLDEAFPDHICDARCCRFVHHSGMELSFLRGALAFIFKGEAEEIRRERLVPRIKLATAVELGLWLVVVVVLWRLGLF